MRETTAADVRPSSFDEYAAAVWPRLYRYAYLLTGQHADAEDLAQQTLVRTYQSWDKVRRADAPLAYVRRTLTNTYLSSKRPKARRLEVLSDVPPEPGAHGGGPHDATSAVDDHLQLWPHVQALPPRQRAVVVLRFYEELSEREIAEALGCSPGTVKSTSHHALNSLRAALADSVADRKEK